MSAGVASLLLIAAGFVVLVFDLLVPLDDPSRTDDVERGSTTILPEDR